MRLQISLLIVFIIFASCSGTKTNNSLVKLTDDEYFYYYEQASPYIHLSLLGDYKFQPYKTKYFRDIEQKFIKYSTAEFALTKPSILYSAHTIVQPFYSTVCMLYKNAYLDTININNLRSDLKTKLHTSFSKFEIIKCGTKDAYKISYQVTNSITGIYSSHNEYFFNNGKNIYRLFLWTTNNDDAVISSEAEYIIKEAKFE